VLGELRKDLLHFAVIVNVSLFGLSDDLASAGGPFQADTIGKQLFQLFPFVSVDKQVNFFDQLYIVGLGSTFVVCTTQAKQSRQQCTEEPS
jgi:hypothetical protein